MKAAGADMENSDQAPRRPGRRPEISRADIIAAAFGLLDGARSLASLSLREVARAAQIAPNSFYRHFESTEALALALVDEAGESLRLIVGAARGRLSEGGSIIRSSVEVFLAQLDAKDRRLQLLLREGAVGSAEVRQAVERQLQYFEHELQADLQRIAKARRVPVHEPRLTARAVTRLVFTMGTRALDMPARQRRQLAEELVVMLRMIVAGSQQRAAELGEKRI